MNTAEFFRRARLEISNDPQSRIPQTVKSISNHPDVLYDIHMHIFDKNYATKNFFLLRLIEAVENKKEKVELIEKFYKKHDDTTFSQIFKILEYNTMKEVLDNYYREFSYQSKMIVTPLTMDLRSWLLKPKKTMLMQINEMKRLMNDYPILPFVATNPASVDEKGMGNLYNLFLRAFTGDNKFFGVKIYPALGYLPSHPALMPIYSICQEKNIPVTTHCGGTIIRAKKTKLTLPGYHIVDKRVVPYEAKPPKKPKEFARFLNDPALWEPVLKTYPNLKLNLGHFGGGEVWEQPNTNDPQQRIATINRLMTEYPKVYGDFSYNFADLYTIPKFLNALSTNPNFKKKAMFGTDYWVVLAESEARNDQTYFIDELAKLGLKDALMRINPSEFLFA